MSAVVGIDLSSRTIDLVKLDETTNDADWASCHPHGRGAWERTLNVRHVIPGGNYWADVYLAAIEAPYGRGQTGTTAILNRVVGAVAASLPPHLRAPDRCWIVRPDEWKTGLRLTAKPRREQVAALGLRTVPEDWTQDALDAYCLAFWARQQIRDGIRAA